MIELGDLEAQTQNQGLRARFGIMCTGIGQIHIGLCDFHAIAGGFGGGQLGIQLGQARVAIEDEPGGRFVGFRHVLGHLGHAPLRRDEEITAVFADAAIEQGKQAGLARTVAADKADGLSWVDGGADLVEQDFGAAAQRDVLEADHDWGRLSANAGRLRRLREWAGKSGAPVISGRPEFFIPLEGLRASSWFR